MGPIIGLPRSGTSCRSHWPSRPALDKHTYSASVDESVVQDYILDCQLIGPPFRKNTRPEHKRRVSKSPQKSASHQPLSMHSRLAIRQAIIRCGSQPCQCATRLTHVSLSRSMHVLTEHTDRMSYIITREDRSIHKTPNQLTIFCSIAWLAADVVSCHVPKWEVMTGILAPHYAGRCGACMPVPTYQFSHKGKG